MTWVQNILNALESGLWKFVRIIHSANHDYPYHDAISYHNTEEEDNKTFHYVVGEGNIAAHGDQHKYFTSKRMLIYADTETLSFKLNHADNVTITSLPVAVDATNNIFVHRFEIHTNVSEVFLTLLPDATAYIYCEGVLPQEARDAE